MDKGIKMLSGMQITTPVTSAQKKNTMAWEFVASNKKNLQFYLHVREQC